MIVEVKCRVQRPARECLIWVKRVVLTVGCSLPVYPDERTYSESVGTSQRCQEQTHAPQQLAASLDHLVRSREQRRWHSQADCLGSLYIDDEFKFGRRLHRKVGRIGPAQYQTDIGYCLLEQLVWIDPVRYQATCVAEQTQWIDRWQSMLRHCRHYRFAMCASECVREKYQAAIWLSTERRH